METLFIYIYSFYKIVVIFMIRERQKVEEGEKIGFFVVNSTISKSEIYCGTYQ